MCPTIGDNRRVTRATSDILQSLLRAIDHYDRMGWLDELPEDERANLDLLLTEARENYAPRTLNR